MLSLYCQGIPILYILQTRLAGKSKQILCFSYKKFLFCLLLQCDMDAGKVIGLNLNSPGHELSHMRIIN